MKNRTKLTMITAGLLGAGVCALAAGTAWAGGIPRASALTYSGTLEDTEGRPLSGSQELALRLWNDATSGAAPLCETTPGELTLEAGRFSLSLPDSCTDAVAAQSDVWVEIVVNGTPLPRERISAVPFAVEAKHALQTDTATSADTATRATSADTATRADAATRADTAATAEVATRAVTADSATRADSADLATKAVTAEKADVASTALTADFAKTTPKADLATRADEATHARLADQATSAMNATNAVNASRADRATADFQIPGKLDFGLKYHACGMSSTKGAQSCTCPTGTWLLSGGVIAASQVVKQSYPDPTTNSWRGLCAADAAAALTDCFGVYAICARVNAPTKVE